MLLIASLKVSKQTMTSKHHHNLPKRQYQTKHLNNVNLKYRQKNKKQNNKFPTEIPFAVPIASVSSIIKMHKCFEQIEYDINYLHYKDEEPIQIAHSLKPPVENISYDDDDYDEENEPRTRIVPIRYNGQIILYHECHINEELTTERIEYIILIHQLQMQHIASREV